MRRVFCSAWYKNHIVRRKRKLAVSVSYSAVPNSRKINDDRIFPVFVFHFRHSEISQILYKSVHNVLQTVQNSTLILYYNELIRKYQYAILCTYT